MSETERVTLVGNLTADPELRFTPSGLQVTSLRLAVTPRTRQDDGSWTDGETSFHTINVWRDQASNAVDSLTKGARVLVVGRPKQRTWTDEDGTEHQVTEVDAEEVGPSLRWATAKVTRTNGTSRKASGQVTGLAGDPTRERGANPAGQAGRAPSPNTTPRRWHPVLHHPNRRRRHRRHLRPLLASVGCPDPYAAATAITHHHCDPDTAMPAPEDRGPALDREQPALHLLAGLVGRLLPDLRVPAGQRPKPSPLRTPRRPHALPGLSRGRLMPQITPTSGGGTGGNDQQDHPNGAGHGVHL